jgi:adenylate kinase
MTTNTTSLIFLGPPGSGKGTQAQVLADTLEIPHISTGDMLRQAIAEQSELGKKAQAFMDQGELVPDELLLDLIEHRLSQEDAQRGWILDGFPRNVSQAAFLDQLLEKIGQRTHHVLNLSVPDDIVVTRLLARGRKDDNEETIRRRLVVYQEQTSPLIDYYTHQKKLIVIDGDRSPAEVTQSLQQILQE